MTSAVTPAVQRSQSSHASPMPQNSEGPDGWQWRPLPTQKVAPFGLAPPRKISLHPLQITKSHNSRGESFLDMFKAKAAIAKYYDLQEFADVNDNDAIQKFHPELARRILSFELPEKDFSGISDEFLPRIDICGMGRDSFVEKSGYLLRVEGYQEIYLRIYPGPCTSELSPVMAHQLYEDFYPHDLALPPPETIDIPVVARRRYLSKGKLVIEDLNSTFKTTARERGSLRFERHGRGHFLLAPPPGAPPLSVRLVSKLRPVSLTDRRLRILNKPKERPNRFFPWAPK